MGMIEATEIRAGNIVSIDGILSKVVSQEIRGTGKFGKTVHFKLKSLTDDRSLERSVKAEDRVEQVEIQHVHLQFLYRDGTNFIFMNNETYEQFPIPQEAIGRQEVFLKENTDVRAVCVGEKPVTLDFPKTVELKVVSTPPGVKGQADTTYKEAELENGLKILVPQFIREGETIRMNTDDFSYVDRVTVKSLKSAPLPESPETPKDKSKEKPKAPE